MKFTPEDEQALLKWLAKITEQIDALITETDKLKERMRRLETEPTCYIK